MRVKKISSLDFTLDIINKMFELVGSDLHWYTFEKLLLWSREIEASGQRWFELYSMTLEQYLELRDYFYTHYYDMSPKRIPHREVERAFISFMFQYGFAYDFEPREVPKYVWKKTN